MPAPSGYSRKQIALQVALLCGLVFLGLYFGILTDVTPFSLLLGAVVGSVFFILSILFEKKQRALEPKKRAAFVFIVGFPVVLFYLSFDFQAAEYVAELVIAAITANILAIAYSSRKLVQSSG